MISLAGYASEEKPYQLVKDIPNPKDTGTGYVSNPQALIDVDELDSLNRLLAELDTRTGIETAVVIINDFNENEDDFTFATELFRYWGIGKGRANNGLLLFVSTNRKQYRFVTGYGVEGLLPDITLSTIGDHILVPAFKEQAYGRGIINAIQVISRYLQQPANKKELNTLLANQKAVTSGISSRTIWIALVILLSIVAGWQLSKFKIPHSKDKQKLSNLYADISDWSAIILFGLIVILGITGFFTGHIMDMLSSVFHALPSVICTVIVLYFFFAHLNLLNRLRMHYRDDVNYFDAVGKFYRQCWWHALLSPILLIIIIVQLVQIIRLKKRTRPIIDENGKPMKRIDRDAIYKGNEYLSAGQLKEEDTGSLVYDIWTSGQPKKNKLVPNPGYHYDDFEICPSCGFRTYTKPIDVTVERATYAHGGKAKRVTLCRNCNDEHFIEFIALDRLVRANSSSSSGSSSSSSGPGISSSSSGSWGGGSTGGGGAGGRW